MKDKESRSRVGRRLDFAPRGSASDFSSAEAANPGWVYVLDPHVTVDGKRVVKIGFTRQTVEARARQLSTGAVGGISILHRMEVDDPRAVEARLHARFASKRLSLGHGREFFAVDPDEVIKEMDAIGAQVSRQIADEQRDRAWKAFRDVNGISKAESRVGQWMSLLGTVLLIGNVVLAMALYSRFTVALAGLSIFFVGGSSVSLVQQAHERLMERRVHAPFGDMMQRESARLDRLYPNSSSAMQSRKVRATVA